MVPEAVTGIPYGIRTRVAAVKGRCPRPLDERDVAPVSSCLVKTPAQIKPVFCLSDNQFQSPAPERWRTGAASSISSCMARPPRK